ncbi:GH25 family lysozyme [Sphingobium sp. AN641]|uniref:GH25 family lysozyme n=1 Tax=Sphingobium sp. AN641 TaxID=3133443 RepID=UPI0030BE53BB
MLVAMLLGAGLWLHARGWAPARSDYPVQGLTVDSASGPIDWGTLAAQGADFAYIRAARGQGSRDTGFAHNWAAARSAGMRYGASLDFSLCRRASDQGTMFVTTVPRDNAALPPVIRLDFDPACSARPGRDTVLAELNTLVNQIEGHAGKPVLLNPSASFEQVYRIADGINRTLWLDGNFFPPDYASRPWVMWTASDMRHIEGVDGPVRWNVVTP